METDEETMKKQGRNCEEGRCREIVPKSWGPGPWENEPNRVDFRAFGFPCFVHRARVTGSWCGYVGVTRSHPAFGHHYDSVRVSVHGGLTYSGKCQGHLCHPDGGAIFWLGFDAAHAGDFSPRLEAFHREIRDLPLPKEMQGAFPISKPKLRKEGDGPPDRWDFTEHYWTLEEIIKETKDLARQLRDLTGHNMKVSKGFGEKDRQKVLKQMKRSLDHWDMMRKYDLGSSKFKVKKHGRRTQLD